MRLAPLCLLSLLALASTPLLAERGLPQIRHALFLDSRADVIDDLERLAARGDRAAMHLLGNRLAEDPRHSERSIALYWQAFAEGRGEIRALTSLSRLLDRLPQQQAGQRQAVRRALQQFPLERDPYTLEAALETFLVYPQLFRDAQLERLLQLYLRSCIAQCSSELYRAVLAEQRGQRETAERHYQQAVRLDPRALPRYLNFLGERAAHDFPAFARSLDGERASLALEVVHAIGSQLDSMARLQHNLARLPIEKILLERPHTEAEQARLQAINERLRVEQRYAQQWIEEAAAEDYPPALVARINYMLSNAREHSSDEVEALIARLHPLLPERATVARIQLMQVNGWSTLDPYAALQLIDTLDSEGYAEAELLRADLYSRGGLDQPDQARALQVLQPLAERGSAAAHYRIALIYREGRGICHEPARAYAHARLAEDGGEVRGNELRQGIERVISTEQQAAGLALYQQLSTRSPQP